MKRKHIITLSATLVFLTFSSSCKKKEINEHYAGQYQRSFITVFTIPSQLFMPDENAILDDDLWCWRPQVKGELAFSNHPCYDEFCMKYNDMNYKKFVWAPGNLAVCMDIKRVDLVALDDFNEDYPAGSSLREVVELEFGSYAPFIANNYQELQESDPEVSYANQFHDHILGLTWRKAYLNKLSNEDLRLIAPYLLYLKMHAKAEKPGKHRFALSFQLEDGTELKHELFLIQ